MIALITRLLRGILCDMLYIIGLCGGNSDLD